MRHGEQRTTRALALAGIVLTAAVLTAACAYDPPPAAPARSWFDASGAYRGPGNLSGSGGAPVNASGSSLGDQPIIPFPEVPPVAPPIEGSATTRSPYVYRAAPTGPGGGYGLPLDPGPVTGYGPGGMAKPPGAPPNPPFHY